MVDPMSSASSRWTTRSATKEWPRAFQCPYSSSLHWSHLQQHADCEVTTPHLIGGAEVSEALGTNTDVVPCDVLAFDAAIEERRWTLPGCYTVAPCSAAGHTSARPFSDNRSLPAPTHGPTDTCTQGVPVLRECNRNESSLNSRCDGRLLSN